MTSNFRAYPTEAESEDGEQDAMPQAHLLTVSPQASNVCAPSLVIIPLCRKGDRVGIERLLQAGARLDEQDCEGNTPLHVAVEAPRNEVATVQCLLERCVDVNATNYIGAAPLHYVCLRKSNHRSIANILLENGADINQRTVAGRTPLHFACEAQLPELAEVLCAFSADANASDSEGNTPMHLAITKAGRDTVKRQLLGHLVGRSASPQVPNALGLYPLHLASQGGYIRCAQYLLEQLADAQAVNNRWETPLHLAARGSHPEVVQLLIQCFPLSLDARDIEGNTPLHCCSLAGSLECAVLLLRAGADSSLRNDQKKTPMDLAKVRGTDLASTHNQDLVQALKDSQHHSTSCIQS